METVVRMRILGVYMERGVCYFWCWDGWVWRFVSAKFVMCVVMISGDGCYSWICSVSELYGWYVVLYTKIMISIYRAI